MYSIMVIRNKIHPSLEISVSDYSTAILLN